MSKLMVTGGLEREEVMMRDLLESEERREKAEEALRRCVRLLSTYGHLR